MRGPVYHSSSSAMHATPVDNAFSTTYSTAVQHEQPLHNHRSGMNLVPNHNTRARKFRGSFGATSATMDTQEIGKSEVPPPISAQRERITMMGALEGDMQSYSRPSPSARSPEPTPAIRFYDRNQPYYEFTNFALYPIHWDGRMYPTAEHLFQAHKFMPNEPKVAEHIRELPSSRDALEEAGRLRQFQRADWFNVNIRVIDNILEAKFAQHFSLRDMLLGTGTQQLIEDSPVDSFWGCGQDGLGRNELGKALMRLRDKLSTQPASAGDEFVWRSPPIGHTAHSEEQYTLFGSTTAQKIPGDWTTVPMIDEGKQTGGPFLRRKGGSAPPPKESTSNSRWRWR